MSQTLKEPRTEPMSKASWVTVVLVVLAWIAASMGNGAWTQSIVEIRTEFGIDSTTIGYINSAFMLGGAIGSFLIPVVADRFGRRWGMFICVAMATIGCFFVGIAASLPFVVLARFISVAGQSAEWSIGSAHLSESVPAHKRGMAMGVQQMGSPISTFIVAAVIAVLAANGFGWRANFFLCAIPVVLIIFILLFLKESSHWVKSHERGRAVSTAPKVSWRQMFRPEYRKFTLFALALHIGGGIWAQTNGIWFTTGMRQDFAMNAVEGAQITSWMWLVAIFGYFFAGRISDWIGRKWAFLLMMAFLLIGVGTVNVLLLTGTKSTVLLWAAVAVWGFGLGAHSVMIAVSSEVFPSFMRAAGLGLAIGIGRLAVVVTQPVIGSFVDKTWVSTILLVIALVYALVLIPVFRMPETANRQLEDIVK